FEQARSVLEPRTLGPCLLNAGVERLDLRGRAVVARAPGATLAGDGVKPARGNLRFARERLGLRAYFGEARALAFDLAAHTGKPRFHLRRLRQGRERALRLAPRRGRLVAARRQSGGRLAERRQPRCVAAHLPLGLGVSLAGGVRFVLQRTPAFASGAVGSS